jgi:ADP-heptose:LPS heptosyltransferase
MIQNKMNNLQSPSKKKRFLIGQLGSFGDCLYATAVARQIKNDYPDCHLTWAIGSIYRTILEGNPYIDEIWEFPLSSRNDLLDLWQKFEDEANERKKRGDFDEIFLTQVFPNNLKNFDGTLRSSIFRAYNKPITVPVAPVIRLSPDEIENVRFFAESHHLKERKQIILFECSPKSGQSFVTLDFARAVSKNLIEKNPDISIIISTNEPVDSTDRRIIDGSVLTFRENAELTKYCTLLVGCSSGISWLCTSDWAKPLPMVQLLKKETCMYASFVCDHTYHGLSTDSIIEMTECSANTLSQCIEDILNENFGIAHQKYHEKIGVSFKYYADVMAPLLFQKGKSRDLISSLKCMIKKYGFHIQLFSCCAVSLVKSQMSRIQTFYLKSKF